MSRVGACPVCFTTLKQIQDSGKAGCPHCYTVFELELVDFLRTGHTKASQQKSTESIVASSLSELQDQLTQAVEREEFETAAALRDQIYQLTNGTFQQ